MPITCAKGTSGGKGNLGMFIERDRNVCAAGLSSSQPESAVKSNLEHYLLQDEVDALIGYVIKPLPKITPIPPLRYSISRDMRYAGTFSEGSMLINPPMKSKFQNALEDLKETSYTSYWNKLVGKSRDPAPYLPTGYDIYRTNTGKKTAFQGTLYDTVMPKNQFPVELPRSKSVAYQTDRNYCKTSYNPNKIFGIKSNADKRGRYVKCCLTDDSPSGAIAINTIQANYKQRTQAQLATSMSPCDNLRCVPKDFSFGKTEQFDPNDNVPQCITLCKLNPDRIFFKECLAHLNTIRKCLSKRFDSSFFSKLFLSLKYYDKDQIGWLPKQIVYDYCTKNYIRFNTKLIEPLLSAWSIFDGSKIEYKTFSFILNFTQCPPELPKVSDIPDDCIDFRTTYSEMVKPDQEVDKKGRAGLPSGRYFDTNYPITPDGCCKAERSYLPHESDAKACLCPSIFTNMGLNHRHMYAKRDPHIVKRVFNAAGNHYTDEEFNSIWETAKKYHPKKYVSYETFYRAQEEIGSQISKN